MIVGEDGYSVYQRKNMIVIGLPDSEDRKEKRMSEYIVRETGYPGAIKQEIAQELVRCRDCEYWRDGNTTIFDEPYCEVDATRCPEDRFCGWGERKKK